MGEAKQRKAADSHYGKVPKQGKGIIVSPPITINGNSIHISKSSIDSVELRRAVIFWDRIVKPVNNIVGLGPSTDELFLTECGIFEEIEINSQFASGQISSGQISQVFANCHLKAFDILEEKEPGLWTLSEGENSFNLIGGERFKYGRGALVELHRAIPLPAGEVPLNDLLEFKIKRRDELIDLKIELDNFFSRINNAIDSEFELQRAVTDIDKKCADVIAVGKESKIKFSLSDFSFGVSLEIDSGNILKLGALGALLGSVVGLPIVGAAVGGVTSALKIHASLGGKLARSTAGEKLALSPYRVVSKMINEPI